MVFFGPNNEFSAFYLFSISHVVVLLLFVTITFILFHYRSKINQEQLRKYEIGLAMTLIISEVTNQFWMIHSGIWIVGRSLPLELCNIGLILSIFLLLTRKQAIFELLFFIAVFGATQAIFTPALTYGFPHFRFFHFFYTHMVIVWVALYFMWVRGYKLTFHSVIKLLLFINILLPIILYVNDRNNGNYWFLRHKPDTPSLFDLMGPYPWYIFTLEGLLVVGTLLAWFIIRSKNHFKNQKQHISIDPK
ncbi:TIGR02206 family membrane protein [Chungangia koreensis]|uniref:TIGR02206 family membrane protein n=1 Tax=Chungangia koreensis TaxID=752657 RepID=A0ABV8XBQ3_9LACT